MHADEYSSSLSPVYDRAVRHGGDTLAETKYSEQCQLVIIFFIPDIDDPYHDDSITLVIR